MIIIFVIRTDIGLKQMLKSLIVVIKIKSFNERRIYCLINRQAVYVKRNIEKTLYNHCYRGKQ